MSFNRSLIANLISTKFPPILSSWAYGSAVFPQATTKTSNNLIDLFFIVDNSYRFHTQNIRLNPTHYSGLSSIIGSSYIEIMNRLVFPIHFNSHIDIEGIKIKYGVVEEQVVKQDLREWSYLTMAGRLQKPVKFITGYQRYGKLLKKNLESTLAFALLTTENGQQQQKLYQQICRLSYIGDIRYSVSLQNKNKVQNIVKHNIENFRKLYHPIIEKSFKKYVTIENGVISINKDEQSLRYYLSKSIIKDQQNIEQLTHRIEVINRSSSIRMALYNFFSSSLVKNFVYLSEKAKKSKTK